MAKLTVTDVETRVQRIRDMAGDNEAAHCEQDDLWHAVLGAIAGGQRGAKDLAAAALKAAEVEFTRWYA